MTFAENHRDISRLQRNNHKEKKGSKLTQVLARLFACSHHQFSFIKFNYNAIEIHQRESQTNTYSYCNHQALYSFYLILTTTLPIILCSFLEMRNFWLREVKQLGQGHTANRIQTPVWLGSFQNQGKAA